MRGRGWSNGNPSSTGAGYGIAISKSDRDEQFAREPSSVKLKLEAGPTVRVRLTSSFWRSCSEFRSIEIGRWMLELGVAPWPKGRPPTFDIEVEGPGLLLVRPAPREDKW